jgi:hypothetical protein
MKYIKNRKQFLNEAKIRDLILPRQAKEVSRNWGEKYLDYEEVTPTDKIKQGRWKLSEEDKNKVLGLFFGTDMEVIYNIFKDLDDKFVKTISESIDMNSLKDDYKVVLENFNINKPTIDQMILLYESVFRKIAISDTKASKVIKKDENGRPMRDEEGEMVMINKEPGELVFSNNLVNINTFISDYNNCFPEDKIDNKFSDRDLQNLVSLAKNRENIEFEVDYEIFGKDIYLDINHNPKNILNMSISKFYSSCQHLYSGGYRSKLLSNVFDPNSIPAFLTFDTPITWENEIISENLPLSRMIIRSIENFDDSETRLYFDRGYPDRMKDIIGEMVEKYSDNKETDDIVDKYYFMPDIDVNEDEELASPYMDRLNIRSRKYIGKNTKTLYLNRISNWSDMTISPTANIKEIIIETTDIPSNFNDIKLTPDWVKFKYLNIKSFTNFNKLETDSLSFDKCKFDGTLLDEVNNVNKNIKKLQIISCNINGNINFGNYEKLEELHVLFTLDNIDELNGLITNKSLKKVVISGDLLKSKEDKKKINLIKQKGIKVEIVGPVI